MNKAEQEKTQRAFIRAFNSGNRRWQFNGRTFETDMDLYRGNVWIHANFESGPAGVTVWLHVGKAFNQVLDVNSPAKTFRGEDAMVQALAYLAERFTQAISAVQELEREALKNFKPQIPEKALRELFEDAGKITA